MLTEFRLEIVPDSHDDNPEQARFDIFPYIDTYYNTKRIHSALRWLSTIPLDYSIQFFLTFLLWAFLYGIGSRPYPITRGISFNADWFNGMHFASAFLISSCILCILGNRCIQKG